MDCLQELFDASMSFLNGIHSSPLSLLEKQFQKSSKNFRRHEVQGRFEISRHFEHFYKETFSS